MSNKELIKEIRKWMIDFEATQPGNVSMDDNTFEGSAYNLLGSALVALKDKEKIKT